MTTNCVYKITNLLNNKCYIGSTNNFSRRMGEHKVFINCNPKRAGYNRPLYNAFRKYGLENFTFEIIINNIETLKKARELEEEQIKIYNCIVPNGYNLKSTTEGITEEEILNLKEKLGTKCALVDSNENIIKSFLSLREAASSENCYAQSVERVCEGKQYKTNNKFFRFLNEDNEIIEIENPQYSIRYGTICGISVEDEDDIVYYETIKEAAKKEGVSERCISACIAGDKGYKISAKRVWRKFINNKIIENSFSVQDIIKEYQSKTILYQGERKTLNEWANSIGLSGNGLKARLKKGLSFEEAMSIPPRKNSLRGTGKRQRGR